MITEVEYIARHPTVIDHVTAIANFQPKWGRLTYVIPSGGNISAVKWKSVGAESGTAGQSGYSFVYDRTDKLMSASFKKSGTSGWKASQITFSDGRTIVYTYDGSGIKLSMATTVNDTTTTTDYVNGFVYTNGELDFFGSPEGRVKKNGNDFEYQYNITDHQGNTRILFTSAFEHKVTATFETSSQGNEALQFQNYPSGSGINGMTTNNHTSGGSESQVLNGGYMGLVGVAQSYKVYPGDTVTIEAYARYDEHTGSSNVSAFATALLAAFSLSAPAPNESGTASSAINDRGIISAGGWGDGSPDSGHPKAFVNILIFDRNYNFVDVAYSQVTSTGTPGYLKAAYTIKEAGYAYLYISNEDPTLTDVFFDDVAMTLSSPVIQSNEYYPFGMQTANSWTRDDNKNNFLYDAGSELNTTSGLYDLPYRNYDAALGRFFQVDPMASKDHWLSPFAYGGDNPVNLNDPSGLMVDYSRSPGNMDYDWQLRKAAMDANLAAENADLWSRDYCSSCPGLGGGGSWEMWGDAISVRNGGMSIEEYAAKYGMTTGDPDMISEIFNSLTPQGTKAEQVREDAVGNGASVGESVDGSQGETPLGIRERFGADFVDDYALNLHFTIFGADEQDIIRQIKLHIEGRNPNDPTQGLKRHTLQDTERRYDMRLIQYQIMLDAPGSPVVVKEVNIVPSTEWTSDPIWGNPSTLDINGNNKYITYTADNGTSVYLNLRFQKIPIPY